MDHENGAVRVAVTPQLLKTPTLTLTTSDTIGKIAGALAKAQLELKNAEKNADGFNPGHSYADLAAVLTASKPLAANELALTQVIGNDEKDRPVLISLLMHTSGEWVKSVCPLIYKNDMQGLGSALTYARRYSASAMAGIAQADDDGIGAKGAKPEGNLKPGNGQAKPLGNNASKAVSAAGKASPGSTGNAFKVGAGEIALLNKAEALYKAQGWDNLTIKKYITARYDTTVHKLSRDDFAGLLKTIELTSSTEAFKEIPVK